MAFTKIAAAGIGSTETVTLHSLEVLNNATVGGVLTYEDVTNVDSIGIVTARAGVLVGSGITLSKDGDIFATGVTTSTTFVGALTGNVTGNISGGTVAGSTGTFTDNVDIATSIRHIGDTDTKISFDTDIIHLDTANVERVRVTADGDIVTQGLTNHSFNNDGSNAKVLEVSGGGGTGTYGVLNLSGNQNSSAVVGAIKFCNRENSNSSSGSNANSRRLASIDVFSDTSDSNAGDDCGGFLRVVTKADGGGGSERVRIDSAGRVLIGETSAIIGSSSEFNEIVLGGKTRGAGITLQDTDANTRFQIRTDDAGGDPQTLMNASTNHPITIRTNNTDRIRITGAGSVGIGTENPDQKLNVVDGIINVGAAVTSNDTRIQFTRKDTGIFSWVGIPNWSPSTFYIYGPKNTSPFNEVVVSYGSSEFNFFTGGTERMSIGANGHLTFQDGKRCAFSVKGSNMTRTNADNFKAQFNNDSSTGCFDSGNNFDTSAHEFEAPVNGYYFFHTTVRLDGWSSGYIRMGILSTSYNEGTSWWNIPSTGHIIKYSGSSDIDEMATSTTMYLPATHKAYVYFLIQNETSFTCMLGESSFSGHLIG